MALSRRLVVFYSRKEVSELLRCTPQTLKQWAKEGIGPNFVRVGKRRVLYPADALAQYLRSQPQGGEPAK